MSEKQAWSSEREYAIELLSNQQFDGHAVISRRNQFLKINDKSPRGNQSFTTAQYAPQEIKAILKERNKSHQSEREPNSRAVDEEIDLTPQLIVKAIFFLCILPLFFYMRSCDRREELKQNSYQYRDFKIPSVVDPPTFKFDSNLNSNDVMLRLLSPSQKQEHLEVLKRVVKKKLPYDLKPGLRQAVIELKSHPILGELTHLQEKSLCERQTEIRQKFMQRKLTVEELDSYAIAEQEFLDSVEQTAVLKNIISLPEAELSTSKSLPSEVPSSIAP